MDAMSSASKHIFVSTAEAGETVGVLWLEEDEVYSFTAIG